MVVTKQLDSIKDVLWTAVSCACGLSWCTSGKITPSVIDYAIDMSMTTAEYLVELHNSALTARRAAEGGTEAVRKEVREGLTLLTCGVVQKVTEAVRLYGSEAGESEDVLGSLAAFDSWADHVRQSIATIVPWGG